MFYICAGNSLSGVEEAFLLAVSQFGSGVITLWLWQLLLFGYGLQREKRTTFFSPVTIMQNWARFNGRYWASDFSPFIDLLNWRHLLPPILSPKFLLRRDGQDIFDFYKTLAVNDVSPPAFA